MVRRRHIRKGRLLIKLISVEGVLREIPEIDFISSELLYLVNLCVKY